MGSTFRLICWLTVFNEVQYIITKRTRILLWYLKWACMYAFMGTRGKKFITLYEVTETLSLKLVHSWHTLMNLTLNLLNK